MKNPRKPTATKPSPSSLPSKIRKAAGTILFVFAGWLGMDLYSLTQYIKVTKRPIISRGSTLAAADALQRQGIELSWLDIAVLKWLGGARYGELDISPGMMNKYDFLVALTKAKAVGIDVTLIPGETTKVFLRQTARDMNLSYDALMASFEEQSTQKEGGLFPDTYRFSPRTTEQQLIKSLLASSKKRHEQLCRELFEQCDEQKWQAALIVASIVQKEAASESEMPLVASVIYNRLQKNMPLQMDGTLNYGDFSHQKVTPQRIRNDDSDYNTYRHQGLPSNAVCNVGKYALQAAVKPAKTDYLYFVRNRATGLHNFSNSYSEHLQNIRK